MGDDFVKFKNDLPFEFEETKELLCSALHELRLSKKDMADKRNSMIDGMTPCYLYKGQLMSINDKRREDALDGETVGFWMEDDEDLVEGEDGKYVVGGIFGGAHFQRCACRQAMSAQGCHLCDGY